MRAASLSRTCVSVCVGCGCIIYRYMSRARARRVQLVGERERKDVYRCAGRGLIDGYLGVKLKWTRAIATRLYASESVNVEVFHRS